MQISIRTGFVSALMLAMCGAYAEVYTTTASGGKWSEIAWTPSKPVPGDETKIVIAGSGAFVNDLGEFTLNALTISATASLSGNGLVFSANGGEKPKLATTGAVTVDINTAMCLNAPLTWTGDNKAGSVRLNGPLSGTGDLIHDPTATDIVDYINGDNSAWSGNLDQRLSYIVISNSVNLGTGSFYCTNKVFRVNGRSTLRIYGQNTFANRFYLGAETTALARIDVFGPTRFTAPFGVHGSRIGILNTIIFDGGLYNWHEEESGVSYITLMSATQNADKGVVQINGPVNIRETFYVNAEGDSGCQLKVYINSKENLFKSFQGIRGGVLVMGCDDCYPSSAYFSGQNVTYWRSILASIIDLNGYGQTLGYHAGTTANNDMNSSFKIKNSVLTTKPKVRVMQTVDNLVAPLVTEGPMHFIKDGAKVLTITNAFFVAGTLEVASGMLRLTAPADGRLADEVIVRTGATLDLGGGTYICGKLTLDGGEVRNGELITDMPSTLKNGIVSASIIGAAASVPASDSGMLLYGASIAASKKLSTDGLVFYMPFDSDETYLTDEGPDKVTFACQKTVKHTALGTAKHDKTEKKFGAGSLHLDGKSPLVPISGNLINKAEGTAFPAHVPTANSPYSVAFYYKLESGASSLAGMLGYGKRVAHKGNNYAINKADYTGMQNYYWNKDMNILFGHHGTSHLDGKWHSFVSTWDGTICRFYSDGAEITPISVSRKATDAPDVIPECFWVGATLNANAWKGWLDEMAIFNRAISADEVFAYHLNGVKGGVAPTQTITVSAGSTAMVGCSLTDGLVFHMPFDTVETFLKDEGPDKVTFACQKTVKHTTLGTAICDTADKRFGTGSLKLDGKSPLVPVDGNLLDDYKVPAQIPVGNAPYSVALSFKYSAMSGGNATGFLGYGVRDNVAQKSCNNYEWRTDGWINNYYWGNDMKVPVPITIYDGCWHTLVSTWDGEDWRFWLDGKALAYDATYGRGRSKVAPNVLGQLFWVGACLNSATWNGWLDELAIWNRALTEEEAVAYNAFGVCKGATSFDSSVRIEVESGATLKASNGVAAFGTLSVSGTIDGDLILGDGVVVEEQSSGDQMVNGEVTIEGSGTFLISSGLAEYAKVWTLFNAYSYVGTDLLSDWNVDGNNLKPHGSAFGVDGERMWASAWIKGTVIIFR